MYCTVIDVTQDSGDKDRQKWYHRLFRPTTDRPASAPKLERQQRQTHRRSASELAYLIHNKKELPKTLDIQSMVRLSGKSVFYLPNDYTPCSLVLPTCLRATAQYLEQNVATRGLFRVPGSVKVVGAIVDYYCHLDKAGANISGTVRCATLPAHIPHSIHDVGSVFKRLLSMLPGGILGSLSLFDAFVAINSQLAGVPEYPRTQQSKVRARLIALAIGTVKSQYRRELVCAVFGLLSHIGRVAEVAPREDEEGRTLPTTDLMGYEALGIVFGPLLVCDLLEQYNMNLAAPDSGMLVLPLTAPKPQTMGKERQNVNHGPPSVDKILVANEITEMLISNWRDVVRQMKALGTHHRKEASAVSNGISASASESLVLRLPKEFERATASASPPVGERSASPELDTPTHYLTRKRSRSKPPSKSGLRKMASAAMLSPTLEEEPIIDALNGRGAVENTSGNIYPYGIPKLQVDEASSKNSHLHREQVYLQSAPPRLSSLERMPEHHPQGDRFRTEGESHAAVMKPQASTSIRDRRQDRKKRLLKLRTRKHDKSKRWQSGNKTERQIELTTLRTKDAGNALHKFKSTHHQRPNTESRAPKLSPRTRSQKMADQEKSQLSTMNLQTPAKYQTQARLSHPPATDPTHKKDKASRYRDSSPVIGISPRTKPSVKSLAALFENQNSLSPRSPSWNDIEANIKHEPRSTRWPDEPRIDVSQIKEAVNSSSTSRAPTRIWENGGPHRNSQTTVLRHSAGDGAHIQDKDNAQSTHHDKQRPTTLPAQYSVQPNTSSPTGNLHRPSPISQTILKAREGDTPSLFQLINKLHEELSAAVHERDVLRQRVGDRNSHTNAETCREQLVQARKEILMWRRRAEEAERRNKIFEKFTARLRGIRDAAVAEEEDRHESIATVGRRGADSTPRVRFLSTGKGSSKEGESVMGQKYAQDGAEKNEKLDKMYGDVAALWMAARELLDVDDGR